jgi:hypothetical protein
MMIRYYSFFYVLTDSDGLAGCCCRGITPPGRGPYVSGPMPTASASARATTGLSHRLTEAGSLSVTVRRQSRCRRGTVALRLRHP